MKDPTLVDDGQLGMQEHGQDGNLDLDVALESLYHCKVLNESSIKALCDKVISLSALLSTATV